MRKEDDRIPTSEDFSAGAVGKKVFWDTVQHPMTIFPLAVSALSGLYMGLISFDQTSLAVGFGAAMVGVGSWIYQYMIRGEDRAAERVQELRERRVRYKKREADTLQIDCKVVGFDEGAKEARELKEAFAKLHELLSKRLVNKSGLEAQRFLVLAEDTYFEGVGLLRNALETFSILKNIDHDLLQRERNQWQERLAKMEAEGDDSPIKTALIMKIESHTKRLNLFREKNELIHQLMAQTEVLEAALDSTYLEATQIVDQDQLNLNSAAGSRLEQAVLAARRVEDRLRGMSQGDKDDDVYLEVGKKKLKNWWSPSFGVPFWLMMVPQKYSLEVVNG